MKRSPPAVRETLQRLYPRATVTLLEGGGHAIALARQAEYFATIDAFLNP